MLRDEFGLYGARESCGAGAVRLLHRAGQRHARCRAASTWPRSPTAPSADRRGAGTAAARRRCSRRSSRRGAFQCGFCTPGFVLMTRQLLDEHPDPDDDEIRHYLSGNLCRCAAYPEIVEAVKWPPRKRKRAAG